MLRGSGLLLLGALGGCAGYAADHVGPRSSIISPQLARYGFSQAQAQCVSDRLVAALSVRQLRRLSDTAGAATPGSDRALAPADLVAVSAYVRGDPVRPSVAQAVAACAPDAAGPPTAAAADRAPPVAGTPPAAPPAAAPTIWVNLGSAASGQAIAVEASSVIQEGSTRTGWFRLTNPGQDVMSAPAYRLRIDCSARTINAMAQRQFDAAGALVGERDHGPQGEGALPVEGGTVMELAYLALCT